MDRLVAEIAPIQLSKHPTYLTEGETPSFYPQIPHQLVRVHELLPIITEQRWFRTPTLVTYGGKGKPDPLIEKNFGVLRNNVLSEQIRKDIQQFPFDDGLDFPGFLELTAAQASSLVFPYEAACSRATCQGANESRWAAYALFIGDKLSDWISFWNHIFFVSAGGRRGWRALCLSTAALSDQRTIDSLIKFLRKYAYRNGDRPPIIDWISSSASENELRSLAAPFISRKIDAFPRFSAIEEWHLPEAPEHKKFWPGLSDTSRGQPDALAATVHQIPQAGGLVDLPQFPFCYGNDVRWIQDVYVEYRATQPYYGNEQLAYQLPRKDGIARSFCALPGRANAHGQLSIEMQPAAPLVLSIPDDRNLILRAIGLGRRSGYSGDFKFKEEPSPYQDHAPSDKARYCRGVINLFGGLQSAHQMFDNRFWRRNIYRLANANTDSSRPERSPLFNKLSKHPELWTINPKAELENEISRLEALIAKYARQVRTADTELTYVFLQEDLKTERADSIAENPYLAPPDPDAAKLAEAEAESYLRGTLQDLVNAKILQQGIVARCHQCGSRIWRELSEIKQEFGCPGCGAGTHSPVEGIWYYRLNSLVSKAVSEHGTVALINALAKAREKARNSFIYSPGFSFFKNYEDKSPAIEVDAICLIDGEVWIGEIKTNAREFSEEQIIKLVKDAKSLQGDKAFVYADEGRQEALKLRCETISSSSGMQIVQLYPSGRANAAAYYP